MTSRFLRRVKAYKKLLRDRILTRKGLAFKTKLEMPLAKEFSAFARDYSPGLVVSNPARDIRALISAGPKFDAEFSFLYYGQVCPQFIDHYSETYLANLVKHCLNPVDVEERLRRRPDGKPLWEELN